MTIGPSGGNFRKLDMVIVMSLIVSDGNYKILRPVLWTSAQKNYMANNFFV